MVFLGEKAKSKTLDMESGNLSLGLSSRIESQLTNWFKRSSKSMESKMLTLSHLIKCDS